MDSLFYREHIKSNFNVGLFVGFLLSFIVSVTLLIFLLLLLRLTKKHFFSFSIWEHTFVTALEVKKQDSVFGQLPPYNSNFTCISFFPYEGGEK